MECVLRRVADWRAKLEPSLSRQEEAKPFDIHSYGESVVARFRVPVSVLLRNLAVCSTPND